MVIGVPRCDWFGQLRGYSGRRGKHARQSRNQVSLEARELGKRGFIQYVRGHITIVKPDGLEDASCECYRVIRQWVDELLNI